MKRSHTYADLKARLDRGEAMFYKPSNIHDRWLTVVGVYRDARRLCVKVKSSTGATWGEYVDGGELNYEGSEGEK